MRTFSRVIAQLLLLLLVCGTAMAEENDFPAEIKQYFENEKILEIESYSSSEQLFAAIARDQNHERVLYAFQQINGKWVCFAKTKNAIPKMELKAIVSVSDTYQDRSDKGVQNVPNISIRFLEPNEDHSELWMNFLLDGDRYILRDVSAYCDGVFARYENGAIFICDDDGFYSNIGYIQYTESVNITTFDYDKYISCVKKWDDKYYELTKDVYFDENHPLLYYWPSDQTISVYSAPTGNAFIEANGKAKVSTNDWILIYGSDDKYYFIQYAINESAMRFGYIPRQSLAYSEPLEIMWSNIKATVKSKTNLINDPLGSKTKIKSIAAGTEVEVLSFLNGWAYVEYRSASIVRGFLDNQLLNKEN